MAYNYESPIQFDYEPKRLADAIVETISKKTDILVMNAVVGCGIKVDKDELIKALNYDRDSYTRGYTDGIIDAHQAEEKRLAEIRKLVEKKGDNEL